LIIFARGLIIKSAGINRVVAIVPTIWDSKFEVSIQAILIRNIAIITAKAVILINKLLKCNENDKE